MDFNRAMLFFYDRLSKDKTVVACGDFNVAHRPIDLARPAANEGNAGYSEPERRFMDELLGAGYIDTFRLLHPDEPGRYSWWTYRGGARARNVGWRIDYFIVDAASQERVIEADILDHVLGSDHCPVSLRLGQETAAG